MKLWQIRITYENGGGITKHYYARNAATACKLLSDDLGGAERRNMATVRIQKAPESTVRSFEQRA